MMAQRAQNHIFVKGWILQVRLSKSYKGHNRLDLRQKDKKTQFEGNNTYRPSPRMKCSYIHSSLSKYKIFYSFFSFRSSTPFFMGAISLYSPILFNPNLPLVDHVGNLLDACPIRNLLEVLWVAVSWDILAQGLFPHKCGQLVRCKIFNAVVAAFFSDI